MENLNATIKNYYLYLCFRMAMKALSRRASKQNSITNTDEPELSLVLTGIEVYLLGVN